MLFTASQSQSFLSSGEEDFKVFYHIWAWQPILFNSAEPFEQTANIPLTEGSAWTQEKTDQVV